MTIWAQTAGYTYWETFNATATHLFRPSETVSLEQQLERLNAREVIREYRMAAQEEKRLPERAELHDGMAAIIGPDLAKSFFQRKVNSSPPVEIPMAVDLVDRIVAIYEDDLKMISRIK